MEKFQNILLCIDTAGKAHPLIAKAQHLAETNQANLTVTLVVPELPSHLTDLLPGYHQDEIREIFSHHHEETLKKALETAGHPELPHKVLEGKTYIAVIEEVLRGKYDLLMKAREMKTEEHPILSDTDLRLLRKSPSPLWLIDSEKKESYQKIVVAIDPLPADAEQGWKINQRVWEMASSLAEREKGDLHIVSAWEVFGAGFIRRRVGKEEFQKWEDNVKNKAYSNLQEFLAKNSYSLDGEHIHLLEGHAKLRIPELIHNLQADVLVMGSAARSGVSGFLIGNTAERVFQTVECDLLTIKPKGFVSPISI